MVRSLGSESDTASHFGVWPYLTFKGFDLEDFVLEEHFVLVHSLFN
jgi:hypothetical protein